MPPNSTSSADRRFNLTQSSSKSMPENYPRSTNGRFAKIRRLNSRIMKRSTSGHHRRTPTKVRDTANKRESEDVEDSDTPIKPRARTLRRDLWDVVGTDDEADLVTEPSAGPTPSATEISNDCEGSADEESSVDTEDNDFTPREEDMSEKSIRVAPSPLAKYGLGGRRLRGRPSKKTILKEQNRTLQEHGSSEALPIFGEKEARAKYGPSNPLPPFVFEYLGSREQIYRKIVLTDEDGEIGKDSPHVEMRSHTWDQSDAYRFWVADLGNGEYRHIMVGCGREEGEERFYAWLGVACEFLGPVKAFPVFSDGKIGWGGVNLNTTQAPRESFAMDFSQASPPPSLLLKFTVDPAHLQNLAITGSVKSAPDDDQLIRGSGTVDTTPDPTSLSEQRRDLLAQFQVPDMLIYEEESLDSPESPARMPDQQTNHTAAAKTCAASTQIDTTPMQSDMGPIQINPPSIETEPPIMSSAEHDVIDLVSEDEVPIEKGRFQQPLYQARLPSTPSSITPRTSTLSRFQAKHTILNMSIPPATRELTIYLSDAPSLEITPFFEFIAKQWGIDTQSIIQLLVHLPWLGKQKIIKPHLDSTWSLLLKAIHGAPCWANNEECEIGVEVFLGDEMKVSVKSEPDVGAGALR